MNRPYPSMFHAPQSGTPATVSPPQHDQPGRSMYNQSMYYPSYPPPHPTAYGQSHSSTHAPAPLASSFVSQPQNSSIAYHTTSSQASALGGSPGSKLPTTHLPRSALGSSSQPTVSASSTNGPIHVPHTGTSSINSNAAPGPIPATTPLVVRQDQNGVQWIAFEYSRDRVKMQYTIRCDVECIDVTTLSYEFRRDN